MGVLLSILGFILGWITGWTGAGIILNDPSPLSKKTNKWVFWGSLILMCFIYLSRK